MTSELPTPIDDLPFDAIAILSLLHQHRVEHVLIGGLAAAVHGCECPDATVVIVPARFARNVDRLAQVLRALHAAPRSAPSAGNGNGLSGRALARSWREGQTRLRTDLGALEIDFEPAGTAGHLDLFDGARRFAFTPTVSVEVACPADLVRIAEMRRSPADEASLPALHEAVTRTSTITGELSAAEVQAAVDVQVSAADAQASAPDAQASSPDAQASSPDAQASDAPAGDPQLAAAAAPEPTEP